MARVLRESHGNPSSIYAEGRAARALVDQARVEVAAAIGAEPAEIVFTSGGTEADNLALRGALKARRGDEKNGLVVSAIEHHAVLDTAHDLERHAHVRVSVVGVDGVGGRYVRRGTPGATMQTGGGQEKGRRTGTENVAGIVGLGAAMRLAAARRGTESARQAKLRDRIIDGVLGGVPDAVLNGHRTE